MADAGFATKAELIAERRLRKQSSDRLKELKEFLAAANGKPHRPVPHEAFHAERERRKRAEQRIKELEAEVAEFRTRLADDAR